MTDLLNFGNCDLSYADINAFWKFFSVLDTGASLGMFLQEYLIFAISYIQ